MFKSQYVRDNLASVSKDAKLSPGPGTYISQQMKLVKPDASVKLAQSPFGTAQPRFEYDKEQLAEQVRQMKVAQNEQLTVVDAHVAERRMAL